MKKVLIWDTFPLENIGGPMGYLYNLHEYLKEHPSAQITFLSNGRLNWRENYMEEK